MVFYSRAPCVAIVEEQEKDGLIFTDVRYIDIDASGLLEDEPNFESVIYCDLDLSYLTHSMEDEGILRLFLKILLNVILETFLNLIGLKDNVYTRLD